MLVGLFGINTLEAGTPSTNSRFITTSNVETTTATLSWINGNGNGRIVVVYTDGLSTSEINDEINAGTIYDAATDFSTTGSSVLISNTNDKAVVVYKGTGSTRTVSITGLVAGTIYWITAYEYKNDGGIDPEYNENGGTRNPASFTTKANPAPTKPTGLSATDITDIDAMATWTNGTNTTGFNMDLFNNDSGQFEWEGVDIGMPDPSNFLIEGLDAGTEYGFRLNAYDGGGKTSGYTELSYFTTLTDVTKPEMVSAEYMNNNQFRLYFSEKVSFDGAVNTKFTISFTNTSNDLVSEQLFSIILEGPDNTSAICSTTADLSTIKNGEDLTLTYEDAIAIYVQDEANNKMTTPSSVLLKDWKAPNVYSIERVLLVSTDSYTTDGATYGTNSETIYLRVTFDERVKATTDNFILSINDAEGNSEGGSIQSVNYTYDVDGFTDTYVVEISTGVDDDCDGYDVSVSDNDGDDIIRDASGNVFGNNEPINIAEGFKVDRKAPSSDNNGPLNPADVDVDATTFNAQAVQLGTGYLMDFEGQDQVKDVYNVSNLNSVDPDDLVIITTAIDGADCSIEGGMVTIQYSTDGGETYSEMPTYDIAISETVKNDGYVRFMVNLTSLLNGTTYEGTNVMFQVTTIDIGGNEVENPAQAYFGLYSGAQNNYLLYDVIAPNSEFALLTGLVSSENGELTTESNMYYNAASNQLSLSIIGLPTDNTLIDGYITLSARRGDGEWFESDFYTDINILTGLENYPIDITDSVFISQLIDVNDNSDETLQAVVYVTDNAGNTTPYYTNSLTIDRVRPLMADVVINKVAVGKGITEGGLTAFFEGDDTQLEYFNIADQTNDSTLYFEYAVAETLDVSLRGGEAYLEYRKINYDFIQPTIPNQDNWIKVMETDGEMNSVILPLRPETTYVVSYYQLASNTNLYADLHTEMAVNGEKYEFRLVPIDVAGNDVGETDRMTSEQMSSHSIVLDNVLPKIVKSYSTDIQQFYLQDFTDCYNGNTEDDRYYFNTNTGTVNDAVDVIGAYFEFEIDPSMQYPNNSTRTILEYSTGENWTMLGPASLYSSVNLGNTEDDFSTANYPIENPQYVRVADWVNRQDVTNLWNGYSVGAGLDNTSELRFVVELTDAAGNTIAIYPTAERNEEDDVTTEAGGFNFRYDRTSPVVSNVTFDSPLSCYGIGNNIGLSFDKTGVDSYTRFVQSSTNVNEVNLSENSDCFSTPNYDECGNNELNGNLSSNTGSLNYTVGNNDNNVEYDAVVPFSVQIMDAAGNTSTVVTNESQSTTANQTPTIDTRIYDGYIDNNDIIAYDDNNDETNFSWGTYQGQNLISNNTEYLRITLPENRPDYANKIRIFVTIDNGNNYITDGYGNDDFSHYYLFTIDPQSNYVDIPISTFEEEPDGQDGNGLGFNWDDATENVSIKLGYKFVTPVCEDGANIVCDHNYIGSIRIDRVAPRIVRYEEVLDLVGNSNYREFLSDYEYELATTDGDGGGGDLEDNGEYEGYNVFSGPIVTKLEYNISGGLGNIFNNSGNVNKIRSDFSTSSAEGIGYSILFSEPLYPTELDGDAIGDLYNKSEYIENFVQVEELIVVDSTNFNMAADSNSTNMFNFSKFVIQAPNTDFEFEDFEFNNDDINIIQNYFMLNVFLEGLVGNADLDISLDYRKLVDAAGNRLVDANGDEFIQNIQLGGANAGILLPIRLDNKAPQASNFVVYNDADFDDANNPVGIDILDEECFNMIDKNILYFETKITEENDLYYADQIPSFEINWDDQDVDEVYENNDNYIPYMIGIKSITTGEIIGFILTQITSDNYYPIDDEEGAYKLFVTINLEELETLSENNGVYGVYMFDDSDFKDLDENVSFTGGISTTDFGIDLGNLNEDDFNKLYIVEYVNIYKMDKGINIDFITSLIDVNSYTIDNVAPVLDYLQSNLYSGEAIVANSCYTTNGEDFTKSEILLTVSVNEKKVLGGDCDDSGYLLNPAKWTVNIGGEVLDWDEYSIQDYETYNPCINCVNVNVDIKTYVVYIDLSSLIGYSFLEGSGAYDYSLNVTDAAGNTGVSFDGQNYVGGISNTGKLYIDNEAPEIAFESGADGCYDNLSVITFEVNLVDSQILDSPCDATITDASNWTVSVQNIILTDITVAATGTENVYSVTATIPSESFTENSVETLSVTYSDGLLNSSDFVTPDQVKIVVIPFVVKNVALDDANSFDGATEITILGVCSNKTTVSYDYLTNYTAENPEYTLVRTRDGNDVTLETSTDYTVTGNTVTINISSLEDEDVVSLSVSSTCDNITANGLTIDILPQPTAPIVIDNDLDNSVCYNGSITFTADENNNTGFTYTWEINVGAGMWTTIEDGGIYTLNENTLAINNHSTLVNENSSTTYVVRSVKSSVENACTNISEVSSTITIEPTIIVSGVTGDNNPKRNTNNYTYSASVSNGPATSYTWSYTGTGATLTNATTSTVTVAYNITATSGNLTVTATKGCGTSEVFTYPITIQIEGSKDIKFSSVQKTSMTLTWTSGTGDGKIVLGTLGATNLIDATITSSISDELISSLNGKTANGNWTTGTSNEISSSTLRTSGSGVATYKFVLEDNNNSLNTVNVSNLTSRTAYSFRVIDFVNVNSNRVYQNTTVTTNPLRRVTNSKEGEFTGSTNTENIMSIISPNPAKENINFNLEMVNDANVTIEIYTIEGRKVFTFTESEFMAKGINNINIPLTDLAAGTYTVFINFGDAFIFDTFIIMP